MGLIGEMREQIQIATYTATRDEFNAEVKTWALSGPVWAKVEVVPVGTDQKSSSFQHGISTRTRFTLHYRAGISGVDQVEYQGLRYLIEGIIPDQRKAFLTLETRQINPV